MANIGREIDEALANRVASGESIACAARAIGMSYRTACRRWASPAFKARVRELRADVLRQASARLSNSLELAVDVLRGLLGSESETIRLSAARAVLDSAARYHADADLSERVEALEAIASQAGQAAQNGGGGATRQSGRFGATTAAGTAGTTAGGQPDDDETGDATDG